MPYRCAKYERNQLMRRVYLVGSQLLLYNSTKKEKIMKKMGQFSETYIL